FDLARRSRIPSHAIPRSSARIGYIAPQWPRDLQIAAQRTGRHAAMQKILTLALAVFTLLTIQPAQSQEAGDAAARPAPSVTAAGAQHAIEVLQDDAKRKELTQTRQTIGKTPPAAPAPAPVVSADNLGVQVMVQVSNWFGEVSTQLANAARRVT